MLGVGAGCGWQGSWVSLCTCRTHPLAGAMGSLCTCRVHPLPALSSLDPPEAECLSACPGETLAPASPAAPTATCLPLQEPWACASPLGAKL